MYIRSHFWKMFVSHLESIIIDSCRNNISVTVLKHKKRNHLLLTLVIFNWKSICKLFVSLAVQMTIQIDTKRLAHWWPNFFLSTFSLARVSSTLLRQQEEAAMVLVFKLFYLWKGNSHCCKKRIRHRIFSEGTLRKDPMRPIVVVNIWDLGVRSCSGPNTEGQWA